MALFRPRSKTKVNSELNLSSLLARECNNSLDKNIIIEILIKLDNDTENHILIKDGKVFASVDYQHNFSLYHRLKYATGLDDTLRNNLVAYLGDTVPEQDKTLYLELIENFPDAKDFIKDVYYNLSIENLARIKDNFHKNPKIIVNIIDDNVFGNIVDKTASEVYESLVGRVLAVNEFEQMMEIADKNFDEISLVLGKQPHNLNNDEDSFIVDYARNEKTLRDLYNNFGGFSWVRVLSSLNTLRNNETVLLSGGGLRDYNYINESILNGLPDDKNELLEINKRFEKELVILIVSLKEAKESLQRDKQYYDSLDMDVDSPEYNLLCKNIKNSETKIYHVEKERYGINQDRLEVLSRLEPLIDNADELRTIERKIKVINNTKNEYYVPGVINEDYEESQNQELADEIFDTDDIAEMPTGKDDSAHYLDLISSETINNTEDSNTDDIVNNILDDDEIVHENIDSNDVDTVFGSALNTGTDTLPGIDEFSEDFNNPNSVDDHLFVEDFDSDEHNTEVIDSGTDGGLTGTDNDDFDFFTDNNDDDLFVPVVDDVDNSGSVDDLLIVEDSEIVENVVEDSENVVNLDEDFDIFTDSDSGDSDGVNHSGDVADDLFITEDLISSDNSGGDSVVPTVDGDSVSDGVIGDSVKDSVVNSVSDDDLDYLNPLYNELLKKYNIE